VKITVDTNILVRAVVQDDEQQAEAAATLLRNAEVIAVSLPCLCEFVWVLRRVYRFGQDDISAAIEALLDAVNVAVNRPAVDAGLAILKAGGDFADGLIAYEGAWLGGETFVSFDKKAVALIAGQGQQARLLA
jgi:predicted nucleic-acid-binding protein